MENVRDIFKTLDKDGDRAVNFEEFYVSWKFIFWFYNGLKDLKKKFILHI